MPDKEIIEKLHEARRGIKENKVYTSYPDDFSRHKYYKALDHIEEAILWLRS